jgi:hypothetical protein
MNSDSNSSSERQSAGTPREGEATELQQQSETGRCSDTSCSASSFWFVGTRHHSDLDAVAREYRRTYDALPEYARPKALVVWGDIMGALIVSDVLMHYGLPVIHMTHSVGRGHHDVGVIPEVVLLLQSFVDDLNNYVSRAKESCGRQATRPDEMACGDEGERAAGPNLVDLKIRSFVSSGKSGDIGFKHECRLPLVSAERRRARTATSGSAR